MKSFVSLLGSLALFVAAIAANCSAQAGEKIRAEKVGKIKPLHVHGKVYLAGQPSKEDLELLKKKGVKTVINLRPSKEQKWNEGTVVKDLGMKYYHLPFRKPNTLTDKVFDEAREILKNKKNEPILLHCSSANRVGPIWIAHRVLDDNVSFEQALQEARTAGLRVKAFVAKARDYIKRKKGK